MIRRMTTTSIQLRMQLKIILVKDGGDVTGRKARIQTTCIRVCYGTHKAHVKVFGSLAGGIAAIVEALTLDYPICVEFVCTWDKGSCTVRAKETA